MILLVACSDHQNRLFVLADNVEGIREHSEVRVNGAVIGKVYRMKLLNQGVLLELKLDKEIQLPVGSTGAIENPAWGAAYVSIIPAKERNKMLHDGDTLAAQYHKEKMLDALISDSAKSNKIQNTLDTLVKLLHAPRVIDTISKQ